MPVRSNAPGVEGLPWRIFMGTWLIRFAEWLGTGQMSLSTHSLSRDLTSLCIVQGTRQGAHCGLTRVKARAINLSAPALSERNWPQNQSKQQTVSHSLHSRTVLQTGDHAVCLQDTENSLVRGGWDLGCNINNVWALSRGTNVAREDTEMASLSCLIRWANYVLNNRPCGFLSRVVITIQFLKNFIPSKWKNCTVLSTALRLVWSIKCGASRRSLF